jgi:hypothetical protein
LRCDSGIGATPRAWVTRPQKGWSATNGHTTCGRPAANAVPVGARAPVVHDRGHAREQRLIVDVTHHEQVDTVLGRRGLRRLGVEPAPGGGQHEPVAGQGRGLDDCPDARLRVQARHRAESGKQRSGAGGQELLDVDRKPGLWWEGPVSGHLGPYGPVLGPGQHGRAVGVQDQGRGAVGPHRRVVPARPGRQTQCVPAPPVDHPAEHRRRQPHPAERCSVQPSRQAEGQRLSRPRVLARGDVHRQRQAQDGGDPERLGDVLTGQDLPVVDHDVRIRARAVGRDLPRVGQDLVEHRRHLADLSQPRSEAASERLAGLCGAVELSHRPVVDPREGDAVSGDEPGEAVRRTQHHLVAGSVQCLRQRDERLHVPTGAQGHDQRLHQKAPSGSTT